MASKRGGSLLFFVCVCQPTPQHICMVWAVFPRKMFIPMQINWNQN